MSDVGESPDVFAEDATCGELMASTCAGAVRREATETVVTRDWAIAADLALQDSAGAWTWISSVRDEADPARFEGFDLVHADASFESVGELGRLANVPRSTSGRSWGAAGVGTFALDRCAHTLLVPLFDTDQDLLATFDPDGAERGAEVFEGFSARAVAHDGVSFRAYGVRAEDAGCEGVARFAVQDASTGAIVRTVDVAHDDWPRGTPAWRDGRWCSVGGALATSSRSTSTTRAS